MVEIGYSRGRVGSELSQLGSRWFDACFLVHGVCFNSAK